MSEPVRVLNLFTIMNRGGAETMVMNYFRNMDRTKVVFDFMVHRSEKGAYDDEIEALGGKIYHMPPVRPWSTAAYRKLLREFFKEHKEYKIIHAHMSELGLYAFQEAKKAGVPVRICHAHNRPHGIDLKSFPRWYLKKSMMPYITHMFMCSEESGCWLFGEKNKDKFYQLNNAIDARKFRFDPEKREKMRQELGLEGKVVVGHVGRFNYQKNHTFLLDIFAEVVKKCPEAVLLMVGDGNLRPEMEKKAESLGIKDSVRFAGVRSDIPDVLQAMDVYAFPSLFEGLSVAVVEVQASGVPCVFSDRLLRCSQMTQNVEFLSLNENAETWADKILEFAKLGHTDTLQQIRDAHYDIRENAPILQDYYYNLANGEEK